MEETTPPKHRPKLNRVTEGGLAFIFRDTFGRSPPDYVIKQALNLCNELGIKTLVRLPEILRRDEFRRKAEEAYRAIMPGPVSIDKIFLASLYAVAKNDSLAIAKIRHDARREWREIDQFAKREMLQSLPATIDEMMNQLERPSAEGDIEGWAEALEAKKECGVCSTSIVDATDFAEAALVTIAFPTMKRTISATGSTRRYVIPRSTAVAGAMDPFAPIITSRWRKTTEYSRKAPPRSLP